MTRALSPAVVVSVVLMGAVVFAGAQSTSEPVPATPANAASFLGEWAVDAAEASMAFTLNVAEDELAGEVRSQVGTFPISDIWISGSNLVFVYYFDYQGMSVDSTVTLAPNEAQKRVDAYLDFADGAAQFTGTAAKKPAAAEKTTD